MIGHTASCNDGGDMPKWIKKRQCSECLHEIIWYLLALLAIAWALASF